MSEAGSFSLPAPRLPSPALPRLPHPSRSADGAGTRPCSPRSAPRHRSPCSPTCTPLGRSWPSGPHRDGAYPSSARVVSVCDFYTPFGVCAPLGRTGSFVKPWRAFWCDFFICRENSCSLRCLLKANHCCLFCCLVLHGIGRSDTW